MEAELKEKIAQYARINQLGTIFNAAIVLYYTNAKNITDEFINFANQPVNLEMNRPVNEKNVKPNGFDARTQRNVIPGK